MHSTHTVDNYNKYDWMDFSHYWLPSIIKDSFDIKVLVSYITLTKNIYEPGMNFYHSLWFVPTSIGQEDIKLFFQREKS